MNEEAKQLVSEITMVYFSKKGGKKSTKNSAAVLYFWMSKAYVADHIVGLGQQVGRGARHALDAALVKYGGWLLEVASPDLLGERLADSNDLLANVFWLILVASEAVEDLKVLI